MSREINLFICPVCGKNTDTFRHPFAKVWCPSCGHVLREEGDKSIQHSGLEKIEQLTTFKVGYTDSGIVCETGIEPPNNFEIMNKLNEVIKRLNAVMEVMKEKK